MYKTACKVVVLRNKLIAFFKPCLPSPSLLLKLPTVGSGGEGKRRWILIPYPYFRLSVFFLPILRENLFFDSFFFLTFK